MESQDQSALAGTLTRLIGQIDAGYSSAQEKLCQLVYNELISIGRRVRQHRNDCSLETTDVVHEFLGQMLSNGRLGQMKNRRYFFAVAADQMRCMLIDHWRKKQAEKHGGELKRVPLDQWLDELTDCAAARSGGDLEALDVALSRLKSSRPRQHEVFQLKFFGGLTNQQIAETIQTSIDTVKRDWERARAHVGAHLSQD
jgi:RNA polymerase sigma factor (TIGR02999 family)